MNYLFRLNNIFLQIIIGFVIADIIAGMFHWFEDTYLDYCIDLPILDVISRDNELHHYFPRSMIAFSYMDHITYTLPITIIVLVLLFLLYRPVYQYPYLLISFAFFSIVSNIIHRFSHMRECENNFFILFLQRTGILCSHAHHSLHHNSIGEKYCVISEYNNYILDNIYFWKILEYIIYLLTNIKPTRKPSYDEYYHIHNWMHTNAKLECPITPTKIDVEYLANNLKAYKNSCPKN